VINLKKKKNIKKKSINRKSRKLSLSNLQPIAFLLVGIVLTVESLGAMWLLSVMGTLPQLVLFLTVFWAFQLIKLIAGLALFFAGLKYFV